MILKTARNLEKKIIRISNIKKFVGQFQIYIHSSVLTMDCTQLDEPTGPKHTATLIFFHGSGSSGDDMKEWVHIMSKNFLFPHIKVMYPTAPLQPYTPAGGYKSNVWFDRKSISPSAPEIMESLAKIEAEVRRLIKNENDVGIPSHRIIVGGFSMGGALALHTAYRWDRNLAGTFVFSSFLNENSCVYEELRNATGQQLPPLLQIHGEKDELVDIEWGSNTFQKLKQSNVNGQFHVMESLGHSINKKGMALIKQWVEKLLPNN